MNTLLIGPRGSGKTTIGRLLAGHLGVPFVDLDDVALAVFPEISVNEVWAVHGERAWRDAEVEALQSVLERGEQVIALGGGTPMIPAARSRLEDIKAAGEARIIYLQCDPPELARRLRRAPGDRPSLTGDDVADEIAAVLRLREPTYLDLADTVIDVTSESAADLAARLAAIES